MKKSIILLSLFALITLTSTAVAQQIIVVPGCTGYCNPQPVCDTPPVQRVPMANPYAAPRPMVPAAPRMVSKRVEPLHRWSISVHGMNTADDYGTVSGGGLSIGFMFNKNWGIQAGFSVLTSDDEWDYRAIDRFHISAIWFPSGVKNSGLSIYFKAGFMAQTMEQVMAGGDARPMNNYNDEHEYYYEDNEAPTGSGTTVVLGGGLQWRMLSGHVSLGLEATVVGPVEDEEYGTTTSRSFNLAFLGSLHF